MQMKHINSEEIPGAIKNKLVQPKISFQILRLIMSSLRRILANTRKCCISMGSKK